ncbi:RHS domain-containing protein [Parachitinimonas caeni]
MTNASGQIVWRAEYLTWGNTLTTLADGC